MGEPREYGPKGGTVLFLDLLAIFSPNLSEIEKNSVPSLSQEWYNLTKSLSYMLQLSYTFTLFIDAISSIERDANVVNLELAH